GNIIALGEAVTEKINRFESVYPIGLDFEMFHFQPDFVKKKIDGFVKNLLQAIGIVVVVMLIFLGLRTGLVIVSLIPMAIVMALMIMGFLDIGLDQMSLSALIISLGLVVDNAIVMSESIMVQMQQGKKPVQAALESASELRVPLLISSLTTSAAFLPIYLAESTVGEYTAPIFEVVTITLICSWILALTMTPLFCVIFFKVKNRESKGTYESKFYRSYRRFLLLILRHRMLSIIAILVIFFATMQLTPYIPAIFFPANDKPVMYAELKLPVGTPLTKTEKMVYKIESFIQREMTKGGHITNTGF
ncbi:MAG: efflux RND transporter permease subunit, partial [Bacteroidetes bacterium]|nr:efflux RND transporter permease subunit [Bacteroidota bacterium]